MPQKRFFVQVSADIGDLLLGAKKKKKMKSNALGSANNTAYNVDKDLNGLKNVAIFSSLKKWCRRRTNSYSTLNKINPYYYQGNCFSQHYL